VFFYLILKYENIHFNIMKNRDNFFFLAVIIVSNFTNPLMLAAVNVALPTISIELNLNSVEQAWVAMSFLLSSAIFLIPFGKAADMLGRKKCSSSETVCL